MTHERRRPLLVGNVWTRSLFAPQTHSFACSWDFGTYLRFYLLSFHIRTYIGTLSLKHNMPQNPQATDNSHVALISIKLHADGFTLYRCNRPIPPSVNLGSLTKGDDDKCTLKATDDGDVLSLKYEASRVCITMLAAGSTHIVHNLHSLGESVWARVEGKAADMVDAVDALDVVGAVGAWAQQMWRMWRMRWIWWT